MIGGVIVSAGNCCKSRVPGALRRGGQFAGWIVPSATLALLPKCPACVAGYIALTGMGVSLSTAKYLRMGLIVFCVVALAYFAAKGITNWWGRSYKEHNRG